MNTLMITILSLSLSGSIFIAILFISKPLFKSRLSKRWQYYIWLIVIARMLLPFSFEINFVGSLFSEINQTSIATFWEAGINTAENSGTINITIGDNDAQTTMQNIFDTQIATQNNIWDTILPNLWIVWLMVALMLLVRKITIYQSFIRYVKVGRDEVSDIKTLERFGKLVEQASIKGMVGFYTNSNISSPLLIGFFRPYIVLPTLKISEADFCHTIMHELTHYKRGDMFYKWLVQLTICIHWFNPFVYLMAREINNACEFSCDESVIKDFDYNGIRGYGDTLLNALGTGGHFKNSLSSMTLNENKKILKERLSMIKNFKKKSRFVGVVTVLVTILLSMGVIATGAYAITTQQPVLNGDDTEHINTPTTIDPNEEIYNLPTINGNFSFEIPYIAAGEVTLIGRVYLDPDNPVTVVISEYQSEYGFFLGLNDSSDIQTKVGTHWSPFIGNQRVDDNRFTFTSDHARIAYLYIGNGRGTNRTIGENVFFDTSSIVGNRSLTNVSGMVYSNHSRHTNNTVEIDIPHIYTTHLLVPHNPLFIESVVVYPGDIITFDMSTDVGLSPYIGLSHVRFSDPLNQLVNITGGSQNRSGTLTVSGEQPQYMFVFVQSSNQEPIATYFHGTIVIERTQDTILSLDGE